MDQRIEQPPATPERRRTVAAWEALERAEALLPADQPAAWHLAQALAAMEAAWCAPGAGGERAAPMPC